MTKDTQIRMNKKEQNSRTKKAVEEKSRNKKKYEDSDSDNGSSESDSDDIDVIEYRKFLSKLFPSKNLDKKNKAGEKLKNAISKDIDDSINEKIKQLSLKKNKKTVIEETESEEEEWETDSEEEDEEPKKSKKNKASKKQNKKKKSKEESESDDCYEDDEESEEDDNEIEVKGNNKFNIIFTIGGAEDDDEDEYDNDSDYEESDESYDTEDEDASVSSDEDDEEEYEEDEDEDEELLKKKSKHNKASKKTSVDKNKTKSPTKQLESTNTEVLKDDKSDIELLAQLKEIYEKNKGNKSIHKCIEVCEENIKKNSLKLEKKEKKHKEKNMRIFRRIVKDKNTMNDFSFYEKLELPEQKKIIKELREINKITRVEKPYRMTLLESDIPVQFKGAAMKKINSLRYMEPGSGEFYKIKNWVDTFMRMPFGKYENLPISIEDGVEKCHEFMENAQKTLDSAVYGLNDAKMQIMQMLGQLLTNPKSIGTAIAIHGPPGTGKTSLVKEGISKILNRPFAFIALGGATDSSFLEGHGYTYEGSTWGKIVQILIDSKCMNPVIYFDELDKISDTPRGEEIAGILTHLTDTSQNSQFHDKYFAEINFDLSKCLFIFSYNDESKVNPILKDRMYRIQTKGYNQKQKTVIGNSYLLPKIREQVRFLEEEITIPDVTIHYIIENHCNKEDGVRNLKRCLEIIYTKLNLYRLMKPGSNLFEEDMSLKVEFPFTVTKDIVDKLIKLDKGNISALYSMYV